MAAVTKVKPTGYDKYVDWKLFFIPVALFFAILLLPTVSGMKNVGAEYSVGPRYVIEHITQKLFNTTSSDAEQWQLLAAQVMGQNMQMGAMSKARFLKRDLKWCRKYHITADALNLENLLFDRVYSAAGCGVLYRFDSGIYRCGRSQRGGYALLG